MRRTLRSSAPTFFAVVSLVICFSGCATDSDSRSQKVDIDPQVFEAIERDGQADFWVVLREQADLSPAFAMRDWDARGQFVYERLRETAVRTQAPVRSALADHGAAHRGFWLVNAIKI